ncbi:MAG: gluconate 2-dehydrogenase subunit 3 family protein [Burkholderiaceae bacterium]
MDKLSRRSFLKAAGASVAAVATTADARALKTPEQAGAGGSAGMAGHAGGHEQTVYSFFNADDAAFIEAAVDRLIPGDEVGPGALDAGVPSYLDKQLAGAWGAGERLYRSGPWHEGTPQQGYQLPYTPAELFRTALRGIHKDLASKNTSFAKMAPHERDAYLTALQNGDVEIDGVPSKVFFESLWGLTVEGYFSDPVYGGNKDMVSWKMIGFPGAYANFYHLVDNYGMQYRRIPISLAEDAKGHIEVHPNIPAYVDPKGK